MGIDLQIRRAEKPQLGRWSPGLRGVRSTNPGRFRERLGGPGIYFHLQTEYSVIEGNSGTSTILPTYYAVPANLSCRYLACQQHNLSGNVVNVVK
jgi:hypothetical protein